MRFSFMRIEMLKSFYFSIFTFQLLEIYLQATFVNKLIVVIKG